MNFTVLITNACNLNCKYCFLSNKKAKTITIETIDKVVAFILDKTGDTIEDVSVVVYGGEPLIAFDELKYLVCQLKAAFAMKNHIKFHITTNGTLLSGERAVFIAENFDSISLSVDGTKEAHDSNRAFCSGEGSYEHVIPNMLRFIHGTDRVVIGRMTVNTINVSYLAQSVSHLIDLGFKKIEPVVDQFDDWNDASLKVLESECLKLIDIKISNPYVDIGLITDAMYRCKNAPCNGGNTTFTIDTDGRIFPCVVAVGIPQWVIGDVANGIDNERTTSLFNHYLGINHCCDGCTRYEYCDGTRCKIINKIQTGSWDIPKMIVCDLQNLKVSTADTYLDKTRKQE